MGKARRLYRVYYTVFDDGAHENVVKALREYGEVVYHPSRVHPEFRFVEVITDRPGLEDEIAETVKSTAGVMHVKVDWIDTSK